MFEYEWENPSHILLPPSAASDDQTPEGDYSDMPSFLPPAFFPIEQHSNNHTNSNYQHAFHTVMDPSASYSNAPLTGDSMLSSADYETAAAFFSTLPKAEPADPPLDARDSTALDRIGLNLGFGGRTYFSASDESFLNRLYRRSRPFEGASLVANSPKCQVEGCNADLSNGKHYHRRHKVCEFHSKASTVFANGLTHRFCQQCSRFHMLTEFDNGKRSCRRRLADHNRRRRKSHQDRRSANKAGNSSGSENPTRSPSRAPSVSSLTMAASPPMQESKLNRYSSEASPSVSSSNSVFY